MHAILVPVGSAGDVHPFVGIGVELRARGHRVTVITNPKFESLIRSYELEFLPLGTVEHFDRMARHPDLWHLWRGPKLLCEEMVFPYTRAIYDLIESCHEPGNTVLAAATLAVGARVARDKLNVPMATIALQPIGMQSVDDPPHWPMWLRSVPRFALRAAHGALCRLMVDPFICPRVNAVRRALDLPPVRRFLNWTDSPDLVLGLFPAWFAQPQADWPAQARLADFPLFDGSLAEEPSEELERFLAAGHPPVVFAPGSANYQAHEFFKEGTRACQRIGVRGILLTRDPSIVPSSLPEYVRHFEYVPLSRLLPRSAALVHHGGIGTASQALRAGIPQLVMPICYDQPDNAQRLRELGVAAVLSPREFRAAAVGEAITSLLNDGRVAGACRRLALRLEESRGIETACDALERLHSGTAQPRSAAMASSTLG